MGEEFLSPPETANNGGGAIRSAPFPISEMFDTHCPYYLSVGMTWDQFWYGDAAMTVAYRKAQRIRNKRENQQLWMQGAYVYKAILCASPILHAFAKAGTKPEPYPDMPYPIDEADAREQEIERLKQNAKAFAQFAEAKNYERKVKNEHSDHDRRTESENQ